MFSGRRVALIAVCATVVWFIFVVLFWASQPLSDSVPVGVDYTSKPPVFVSASARCNALLDSAAQDSSQLPALKAQPPRCSEACISARSVRSCALTGSTRPRARYGRRTGCRTGCRLVPLLASKNAAGRARPHRRRPRRRTSRLVDRPVWSERNYSAGFVRLAAHHVEPERQVQVVVDV